LPGVDQKAAIGSLGGEKKATRKKRKTRDRGSGVRIKVIDQEVRQKKVNLGWKGRGKEKKYLYNPATKGGV